MSPSALPQDKKWLALALLALAQFVVVLDASIVNVALPSIGRDLQFSQDDLSWVVNSYTLFFGGFLLLGGRMADLIGRRRLFMAGLVLFALASLAGGFASSPGMLIAARAVQGLGAALLSPAALSLVTVMFAEGAERNKAMGVWGAVAGSGGAAGVLLGGVLTEYAGWEWVLFVNVPIGIAAAALAPRLLPESRNTGTRHFDIAGAVSVTAGLSLLVYTLVDASDAGWTSGQTLGLGAVALALIGTFILIETRLSKAPLVPFDIFRNRTISGTNVVGLLVAMALFSMFFFVSLYMQQVLGYDALEAGLAYLPLALGIIVSAGIASALVTRFGFKPILVSGLVLTAAGLIWFAQVERRRVLRERHPRPVAGRRRRAGLRLRADDDCRRQCRGARGGPGVRPDQHVAADRRRARPGHPGLDRQLAHGQPGGRRRGDGERVDRRLPARVHRRRRVRHPRRDRRRDADLVQGQPRARARRAGRRRRARPGGGLTATR